MVIRELLGEADTYGGPAVLAPRGLEEFVKSTRMAILKFIADDTPDVHAVVTMEKIVEYITLKSFPTVILNR